MDKSWLLDPKVVSLVKSMRRYISSEFGVSLSLTDDSLYEQLSRYAEKTRNERLRALHSQLEETTGPPEPEPAPEQPERVYRGQVMASPEPPQNNGNHGNNRPKRERMYRGRPVTD